MTSPRRRAEPRRRTFTELGLRQLRPPKSGQQLFWDSGSKGQLGLALLVSSGGTKTYRSTFYLDGKPVARKLGRVGEMPLDEARRLTLEDRKAASQGVDPRSPKHAVGSTPTFGSVVDRFIEEHCKPRQRTWPQTRAALVRNCAALLDRPMAAITKADIRELLRGIVAEGKPAKARLTHSWLRRLWRWCVSEDIVEAPIVDGIASEVERRVRDRVYSDDEIRAAWAAADRLGGAEAAFVKLLILLVPRVTALACLRWSDLDDDMTLWTTPHELTKTKKTASRKRVYLTPLSPLARRILMGLPRHEGRVFPDLPIQTSEAGQPRFNGTHLRNMLVDQGAPADFQYHAWRHTIATYLENAGHSEWERGLVLNHSGSGSVTSGYSHGYPLELKQSLLTKWSDHVEQLVRPEGAALLR
jgi:integrase